jgi:hypothetical protein
LDIGLLRKWIATVSPKRSDLTKNFWLPISMMASRSGPNRKNTEKHRSQTQKHRPPSKDDIGKHFPTQKPMVARNRKKLEKNLKNTVPKPKNTAPEPLPDRDGTDAGFLEGFGRISKKHHSGASLGLRKILGRSRFFDA